MFSAFFNFLYELVCGANSDSPEYRQSIFGSVGLLTVLLAITICLIFYVGLGRWKNVWHRLSHWIITLILLLVSGFVIAYYIALNAIGYTNAYLIKFAIFNGIYAAVYFVAFSFLLKRFSIHSKYTPV